MLRSYVFTGGADGLVKVWQPKCLDTSVTITQLRPKEGCVLLLLLLPPPLRSSLGASLAGLRFLTKEGASNKTWQKRYFRLRSDFVLEYGKDQKVLKHRSYYLLLMSWLMLLLCAGYTDEDDFTARGEAHPPRA